MNNQNQYSTYTYQPAKTMKKDHSIIVMVIGIVFSVIIAFVGLIFLFVNIVMNYATQAAESYDEVTAQVISTEREWSGSEDEYVTINEIEYYDKDGALYHGTINGDLGTKTVTIYCNPQNYSEMMYFSDLGAMNMVSGVMRALALTLLITGGVMLIASIIIGIVMKKNYKKRLAEFNASGSAFAPQTDNSMNE